MQPTALKFWITMRTPHTLAGHSIGRVSWRARLPFPRYMYAPACVQTYDFEYATNSTGIGGALDSVAWIRLFRSAAEVVERKRKC